MSRVGEVKYNNFGSKMIIIKDNGYYDVDIYFEDYNWVYKNGRYDTFRNGQVKCPYEPRLYNIGYIGEGKYQTKENGKHTKCYITWSRMLERCYSEKYRQKHETYEYAETIKEWHNFQNFAKWFDDNYYEVKGQRMELDKDILYKGNKIYSPNTCVFVPQIINILFIKSNKSRGKYPIGVYWHERDNGFRSQCNIVVNGKNKRKYLGLFHTSEEAFQCYKQFKEKYIKKIADEYKNIIPIKLYEAMYKYEVEIND